VNPSPLQPEAPELPATTSAPSHLETSALPGTPPSPVIAPEQSPAQLKKSDMRYSFALNSTTITFSTPNSAILLS
jgi:hypothetical protein